MSNNVPNSASECAQPQSHQVTLSTPAHFNFEEILAYLNRSPNECLHATHGHKVRKLIPLKDKSMHIEIEPLGEPALSVTFTDTPHVTPSTYDEVITYVRDWLDMDTQLDEFYTVAQQDDLLRPVVNAHKGLRIVGIPDLFEAICWAIIGQQINLTFAYELKRRFVESFGTHCTVDGRKIWMFPSPNVICTLQATDLTDLQFTRSKAAYILEVASRMSAGTLNKESLQGLGDSEQKFKVLTDIRGIGPWTANYVLMRCLRDRRALPVEDVGLQNAIKLRLGMDRKPTIAEVRKFAEKWVGWEAYATFYLWRSLEASESASRQMPVAPPTTKSS